MNISQKLMGARLGLYNSGETKLEEQDFLLNHQGGYPQQDRMIKDKYRSFLKALKYSYQGAWVKKPTDSAQFRALINPNKTKQDYDDKIISVSYDYDLKSGDIFNWVNTNSYWIIYLQDLTELAYFKGDIRKCNYTISWKDVDGKIQSTYAAVRGPVETKINFIQKGGISIDTPNHSLNILMPKNKETLAYFKRYAEFYLQEDANLCWRVEGVDAISMPGVLEINAVEYYKNETSDSEGIVDNLIVKPVPDGAEISEIEGDIFIKPKITYKYYCATGGEWSIVEQNFPVVLSIRDQHNVSLKWDKTFSGQFTLKCGEATKTIVVESLF